MHGWQRTGAACVALAAALALAACRPGNAPKEPTDPKEPTVLADQRRGDDIASGGGAALVPRRAAMVRLN